MVWRKVLLLFWLVTAQLFGLCLWCAFFGLLIYTSAILKFRFPAPWNPAQRGHEVTFHWAGPRDQFRIPAFLKNGSGALAFFQKPIFVLSWPPRLFRQSVAFVFPASITGIAVFLFYRPSITSASTRT